MAPIDLLDATRTNIRLIGICPLCWERRSTVTTRAIGDADFKDLHFLVFSSGGSATAVILTVSLER